jgi:hypothetical protein
MASNSAFSSGSAMQSAATLAAQNTPVSAATTKERMMNRLSQMFVMQKTIDKSCSAP